MNRSKRNIAIVALLALAAFGIAAEEGPGAGLSVAEAQGLLARIDEITNFAGDFSATFAMVSIKEGEAPKDFEAKIWRRDGEDKLLILMMAPEARRGEGYLEIDKNLWFYDPRSRLFSHSSLRDSFQDSDAMNNDFYRTSFATDYAVAAASEGKLGEHAVFILDLKARSDEVAFPFKRVWVRKDLGMILKAEDYGLSRKLLRTAYYPSYVRLGDQYVASRMLFVDELDRGDRTQGSLKAPVLAPIPDSVFTKAFLERSSR